MYGLVNKALEQVIHQKYSEKFDAGSWDEFRRTIIPVDEFQNMHQYPDELTYQVVGAAAEALGISTDTLLEAVGRYWLLHTSKTGYGLLVQAFGRNPRELLMQLDNLHTRLRYGYIHLSPPSFSCSDVTENSMLLHYYSKRSGLTIFVVGLLKGVADHFQTEIGIEIVQRKEDGFDHDIFRLQFLDGAMTGKAK